MTSDPVVEARELQRRILAVREDQVFTKRWVIAGFLVLMIPLLITLGGVFVIVRDTNAGVERQVLPLQARVQELEATVADQEEIITEATDAVVLLIQTLQDNGITPPEIIIRADD